MDRSIELTLGRSKVEWEPANCGIFLDWHGRLIEVISLLIVVFSRNNIIYRRGIPSDSWIWYKFFYLFDGCGFMIKGIEEVELDLILLCPVPLFAFS